MSTSIDFDRMVLEFMQDDTLTVVYLRNIPAEYDPETGESATSVVEINARGILQDLTLASNGLSTKFGTNIVAGDKELVMQPIQKADALLLSMIPNPSADSVIVAGITYSVENMKEVNPTGSNPLVYFLHLRR